MKASSVKGISPSIILSNNVPEPASSEYKVLTKVFLLNKEEGFFQILEGSIFYFYSSFRNKNSISITCITEWSFGHYTTATITSTACYIFSRSYCCHFSYKNVSDDVIANPSSKSIPIPDLLLYYHQFELSSSVPSNTILSLPSSSFKTSSSIIILESWSSKIQFYLSISWRNISSIQ